MIVKYCPCQKKNRQIRACVDYRDVNKACPKDDFPLPNMDLLFDSTYEQGMLSFYGRIQWLHPKRCRKDSIQNAI